MFTSGGSVTLTKREINKSFLRQNMLMNSKSVQINRNFTENLSLRMRNHWCMLEMRVNCLSPVCVLVCAAQFQCVEDSQCVDYYKVCDHHPDCPEASDEMNCTAGNPSPPNPSWTVKLTTTQLCFLLPTEDECYILHIHTAPYRTQLVMTHGKKLSLFQDANCSRT